MSLKQIKEDTLQLRKSRDPMASKMVTLLSAINTVAKDDGNREPTDDDTVKVINKFLKGVRESLDYYVVNNQDITPLEKEIALYEKYLPKMMNAEQTDNAVRISIAAVDAKEASDMGKVMAHLKKGYGSSLDMKMASNLVREKLSNA